MHEAHCRQGQDTVSRPPSTIRGQPAFCHGAAGLEIWVIRGDQPAVRITLWPHEGRRQSFGGAGGLAP